jgi:RNA methyltransferase, TrmH family
VAAPPSRRLTSRRAALVRRFRDLARGDGPADEVLLDGAHLLREAMDAGLTPEIVVMDESRSGRPELARLATRIGTDRLVMATADVINAISPVTRPSGVVSVTRRPGWTLQDLLQPRGRQPLIVVASGVQDPGNIGSLLRAAEAGGATGVFVTGPSADPWSWKALRGAMGSALRLPVMRLPAVGAVIEAVRAAGMQRVGTVATGGAAAETVNLTAPTALFLGGEGGGLDSSTLAACDTLVSIPMTPPVESLNVAVAAALLVYEARRQRHLRR